MAVMTGQSVCPYNDPASAAGTPRSQPVQLGKLDDARGSSFDVVELLQMADDELMAAFGHWYIPRRQPEYLRRNALIVLGNVGDPVSEGVEHVLRQSLMSPSAVVAGHAVWAARRLGRDDLVERARAAGLGNSDPDGLIAEELAHPVQPRRIGG